MPDAAQIRPARSFTLAFARLAALSLATLSSALMALPASPGSGPTRETRSAATRAPLGPVAGEVIVKFKPGAALTRQYALSSRRDASAVRQMLAERASVMATRLGRPLQAGAAVGTDIQVLRASGISAAELAVRLAADPDVEFAEPNERMRRTAPPNDPLYATSATERRSNGTALQNGPASGQWYLRAPAATLAQGPVSSIDIETAWARTRGSGSVVVAVLDTGVRPEHPDLVGRLLSGYDFVSNATVANDGGGRDADPSDPGDWVTSAEAATSTFSDCDVSSSSWHGTSTSSLVGAKTDDNNGMAGAAPGVTVLPVRVLGKCYGDSGDIQAAMRWAAGIHVDGVPDNPHPAKVLNLSLGGSSSTCSAGYQAAVNEVLASGAVIVAAAGNSAGGPVGSPANCQGVIAVAGLRHAGTKVGFSDLGTQISIAAPAGNCINVTTGTPCLYPVLAATNSGTQGPVAAGWTDSYNITVGTSFASPLVAATAGLMLSLQPALTPAQVLAQMKATARPFPTTGGDNGDGSVVPQCTAPRTGVDQLQCYCNTNYCGAGMLDSRAVLAAVSPSSFANIASSLAAPVAGEVISFRITGLQLPTDRTLQSYAWALTDAGTGTAGFSSSANADTATLTPAGAGRFTVTLTVTDNTGATQTTNQVVTVAAAPVVTPPVTPTPTAPSGGGGGGSMSLLWLAALAAAVVALFRCAEPAPRWLRRKA